MHIIKKGRELLRDEKRAPKPYRALQKIVKLKSSKRKISGIISDEKRHKRILNSIIEKERRYDRD